ncbi:hypothetical protein F7725_020218, partial [Dissostichus mawsoni]
MTYGRVFLNMEHPSTGISHQQEKRMDISYVVGMLSFTDTPKIYDQGSVVEGKVSASYLHFFSVRQLNCTVLYILKYILSKTTLSPQVKAVYYNNTPIADMPVYLFMGERRSAHWIQNLTTDSNGVAPFSFSTVNVNGNIRFQLSLTPTLVYHHHRTPYYEAGHHTVSMAQVSSPDTKTVSFLEVKKKDKPLPCEKEEEIFIQYTVVGEAQGSVDMMYLVLSRGAIVMQGVKRVEVQDKSVNEGQVSFKLTVSPDMAPDIQVIIYAILPSETVIAKSADFSIEKCFSHKVSLEFSPSSAVPGEQTTLQVKALPDSLCGVSAVDQSVLIKEPGKTLEADKIFNLLPVKKASHVPHFVEDRVECLLVRPRRYAFPYPERNQRDDAHTVFQNVGMKMATNLVIRVPSCLKYRGREYHQGHGMHGRLRYKSAPDVMYSRMASPSANQHSFDSPIETVRTFFPETWIWELIEVGKSGTKDVSVTVPDTITTWETEAFCLSSQGFGLAPRKEITVFQPFFLELSLPYSIIRGEHFELKATYTSCLCGGERKTLSWTMAPSALGVVNVSVTAEAVASQASCDNEIVSVPERGRIDVVKRSLIVKAEGTEMSKTYNWLLCPEGEALTEEIEIQLPENVIVGSARASLSVLAQSFVYIDQAKMEESRIWLQRKQRGNGCFEQSGKLFNNRMKGGVSDEVTLSAYITAAFLEMNASVDDPVVNKSLSCLKESISDLSNTYTTALMAYVFTLAGDMETRAHLLNHLDTVAIQQGGFLHWSQTASEKSASLSVEISSYVLLAKLSASPTTEDLGYAAGIDTVVALQALAFYSALVFSPGGSSSVTVQSPSDILTFDVNQNNKLLYQEKLLKDVTGKFSLEVKGTACAAMQISQHYNIPTPTDATTLSVNVRTDIDCASKNTKLTLNLQSRFSGKENSTNMVILDIKALSGFVPDQESLKRLKGALLVDRVEQKEDHVLVYIRELPKDIPINHSLDLRLEIPVQNMKPAVVKIYDYYQPSDQAETEYTHPCVS